MRQQLTLLQRAVIQRLRAAGYLALAFHLQVNAPLIRSYSRSLLARLRIRYLSAVGHWLGKKKAS